MAVQVRLGMGKCVRAGIVDNPKVTFVTPSLSGGGAEKFTVTLANRLFMKGYDVEVLSVKSGGDNRAHLDGRIRYLAFGKRRVSSAIWQLIGYVRNNRGRVYVSNIGHMNLAILMVKLLLGGAPRVVAREANVFSVNQLRNPRLKRALVRQFYKMLYPLADTVVCVSECVKRDLEGLFRRRRVKFATIYNMQGDTKEGGSVHPWLEDSEVPVVVSVGRLEESKNHKLAIDAVRLVNRQRPCRLLILGKGTLEMELKRYVRSMGADEYIDLVGYVDNPLAYVKRSKVFLLTSKNEGMPGAMVQAFLAGVPIVSTDCPCGPREILTHGNCGALLPVDDLKGIAAAILKFLDSGCEPTPAEIEHRKRFSDDVVVSAWESLLREVAK